MPDPPPVGPVTRYVLENPYPLGAVLLVAALIVGWTALQGGDRRRLLVGGALLVAGALVLLVGRIVVTAGEHGEATTRAFVDAVVAEDLTGADGLLAPGATMSFGSPQNPGWDRDYLRGRISDTAARFDIETNRITMLRGYEREDGSAEVHLACWTEVDGGWGPTPTSWVLRVREQPDGDWLIERIAWISANGQPVTGMR